MWRPRTELPVGDLVLRKLTVVDADAQATAVVESLPTLLGHMPWAQHEPLPMDERRQLLATWDAEWWAGDQFNYGVFDGEVMLAGCGLMRRPGPGSLEVGYWVHIDHQGRGIATELSRALTTEAFRSPWCQRVEIHHDVANVASRRIPEKLGFELVRSYPTDALAIDDEGTNVVWQVRREDWARHFSGSRNSA